MLRRTPEQAPELRPPRASLQERLALQFHRLALSWHAKRNGRGRAVALKPEANLVRVHDGTRQICVPDARSAGLFRSGINGRLEATAAKYVGETGYIPREGDVVVDIGAGIGEFTLWCADAGARVVAFEPDPLAFECLQRNTATLPGINVWPQALWKERANLRLHGSPDTTESSLIEEGRTNARLADVEAWPLDSLSPIVALPVIDFMKIDGEGVEPEILAGGLRTLRRTRVIAIDLGAAAKRPNLAARAEAILDSLNFRTLPHGGAQTILALNTAMVGPFSSRVGGQPGS